MFELLDNTLEDDRHYYIFEEIEALRKKLLNDHTILEIEDLGAGSKTTKSKQRSIKSIASSAVSPAYQSQFLYKLAQYLRAQNIVELGTSLGISALYLSAYSSKVNLFSLEGSKSILEVANNNFRSFNKKNISTLLGHFDETLPQAISNIDKLDMVYIDGNHAKKPTLKYFEECLDNIHDQSVLIFDDIYWSREMTAAWDVIKSNHMVRLSLDMYYFGIVFFNSNIKKKQDFKIVNSKFKPWQKFI